MTNFAFMPQSLRAVQDAAMKAESHILGDPRAACFHTRFALETAVHWLYRHDNSLRMPYDRALGALLHEPTFQNLLPENVFPKTRLIQKIGNRAVHNPRPVTQLDAKQAVQELHHICYWLVRTYFPDHPRDGAAWHDERVPRPLDRSKVVPRKQLEDLEKKLEQESQKRFEKIQETLDAANEEIQELRRQLAENRAKSEEEPDTHDYSEADTRRRLIDVELQRAGWPLDQKQDREYPVEGMPNGKAGRVDYVLWGDDGKPLALVEAKRTTADPEKGRQQAKLYADALEAKHGQRPLIFYTNGYNIRFWDDTLYPPREVAGFYKKEELERLIRRRQSRQALDVAEISDDIAGRYYQKRAIGHIFEQLGQSRRKALLVMATGTGKTRTSIALVDVLQRAGWVKRALFLADRRSLVKQAANAFKNHLPDSSPVNLVTEKGVEGRVYVCTYPTMMGLIDEIQGQEARFGVGHFDLVILDEAHRSVYRKYRQIFRYFDSLLVGLTATPREQVDRNTYDLFDLEPGVPTDAYELETAVQDGYLVPPRVQQVDLRFPREGIDYDSLSDEEKEQWESLDWGDDVDESNLPDRISSAAINSWLFNKDTVDKVLQYLMENGHKVAGGDRLGKTIIFARNLKHAHFIQERFDAHYPQHRGHFARVVGHHDPYAESLIDDFGIADKDPYIAISVDMLDTGIDVPEIVNLVFFKPVYSKIKFWQMIGRGTRLCENLFGPDDDKKDFRVFDFCFNFDFFRENPKGIESNQGEPLGVRIFRARVDLLAKLGDASDLEPDTAQLRHSVAETLHREVSAMHTDNFIVRLHLEAVERFQREEAWRTLSPQDLDTLRRDVAELPSQADAGELESRLFDLTSLRLQLALAEGDMVAFEGHRARVVEIAERLEEQTSIPAVAKELEYLAALQEHTFWQGLDLADIEEIRLRLRSLVPFINKRERKVLYTDFQDQIINVRQEDLPTMPKMTGVLYEKKVKDFLRNHPNHLVIHRLRTNQPLTPTDLEGLETTLREIGEGEGEVLLTALLVKSEAPSLVHFVRSLVGMDRAAAQAAFAAFLQDRSLTAPQIRFVEMVVDQLTARGVIPASALYESPFTDLHSGGPDELFAGKDNVIDGIFETLKSLQPKELAG